MTSDSSAKQIEAKVDPADMDRLIRERAHLLWEADGGQEGRPDDYWHRARELIEDECQSAYPPLQSRGNRS